jgi:hypothetical protein
LLIQRLRAAVADSTALGFQLDQDGLAALTLEDLRQSADDYLDAMAPVPKELRSAVLAEHAAHAREAHAMIRRYNTDIASRARGYVELARLTGFELPWPIVAAAALAQIIESGLFFHAMGVAAEAAGRLGWSGLSEMLGELDDFTLRANRSVFADGVPIYLFAIRCARLRRFGRAAVADALLDGPFPLTMDESGWSQVRELDRAFAIDDGRERFEALARGAAEREQRVVTHHIGTAFRLRGGPRWLERRLRVSHAKLPIAERDGARVALVFRWRALPADFDYTDHDVRVAVLGDAFVRPLVESSEHFHAAVRFVRRRFDADFDGDAQDQPAFGRGGVPLVGAALDRLGHESGAIEVDAPGAT